MVTGVIYLYTSPSGKHYVGQTTNEPHRRSTWFSMNQSYAGKAINNARAKYGPENFTYTILHKAKYISKEEASTALDALEQYYIKEFDSKKHGYNCGDGGKSNRGVVKTKSQLEKLRAAAIGRKWTATQRMKILNAIRGCKHSEEATESSKRKRRTSGRLTKIGQYALEGHLVRVWSCIAEAAETLHIVDKNVYRATKTLGKYKGYFWRVYNGECYAKPKERKKMVYKFAYKPVLQYSLDGTLLREYESMQAAANAVNHTYVGISACCRGVLDKAFGYKWKYKKVV